MKMMKLCITALLCFAVLFSAVSAATLSIDPSDVMLGKGESAQLAVRADNVERLGSYDITISWSPSQVSLTDVTESMSFPTMNKKFQTDSVRIAGLNPSLEGVSESADLCYLDFTGVGDNGKTSPVTITVNNYGFLNSTSGEEIPVDAIFNGNITSVVSNVIDARIGLSNRQVSVGQEMVIRASVANQRNYETSSLDVNVTIMKDGSIIDSWTYDDVVIIPGATYSEEISWTPAAEGTYQISIGVTSDDLIMGSPTDEKTISSIDYKLSFPDGKVYCPDNVQMNNWYSMYAWVSANKAGPVDISIDAPDSFEIWMGKEQTRYFSNSRWNYLSVWMKPTEPGSFSGNDFTFNISANGKSDSIHGNDITVFVPSIQVNSVNSARVASDSPSVTMEFNTLHTNNTHSNVTTLVAQSGAQGRTLSGLEYLIGYPYGCVEQTTCKMLASLNVKNYYLERGDRPANFNSIREQANESVSAGIDVLVNGGLRGQNSDGGWSLWGGDPSESSSSSYAGYTLAKINQTDEDLNHLLEGKVSTGNSVTPNTVNFEKLIKWFHDNPDNLESGTWSWSAPVCHAWTKESNTAFVMVIHDMINQTCDVQPEYRVYMEENMQNATRYIIGNQQADGSFSNDDDKAMATALGLWGLESFGLPSDTVTDDKIRIAKERAVEYLVNSQINDESLEEYGSWPATTKYGWYSKGRVTESTAYAILALNATGVPNNNETIRNGVGWLVDTYENSGSWGYTWASQAAIDALIVCQEAESSSGTVAVSIDGNHVCTFTMDATKPREEYTLTSEQMAVMMDSGTEFRKIFDDDYKTVDSHAVTVQLTDGTGPVLLSVENSQWAPLNEIDNTISYSGTIQMEGDDGSVGISQINTNIGSLAEAEYEVGNFTLTIDSVPSPMEVGKTAKVSIGVISVNNLYSPMIEVPIAGFTFVNTSEKPVQDAAGNKISYEILNSTANKDQDSIFIEPESWEMDPNAYSYTFEIVPENYGTLNMSVRIAPLYSDSEVSYTSHDFEVTGTGNVTIHVQDENYEPVVADTITVDGKDPDTDLPPYDFTGLSEGSHLFSVTKTGYPNVHGNVTVNYGETTVYNVTLPSTLTEPALILAEGGSGCIAGVAKVPGELNANVAESTTYNVSVMGDGGELGVALQFPMRYLVNGDPVVTMNGVVLSADEYKVTPGTFVYGDSGAYTTTNATLVIYSAPSETNYIGMEFTGDTWGDAYNDGVVDSTDALYILHFVVGNLDGFETYGYPDVYDRDSHTIDSTDALYILHKIVGNLDEYYQ